MNKRVGNELSKNSIILFLHHPVFLQDVPIIFVSVPEITDAFQLDAEGFKSKYGFDKPAQDAAIVTHCLKGGRAAKAKEALDSQGFSNVQVYSGSFTDWKAQGGDIENM